jgi:quinoprotein glucose dehydrogenase
MKNKLLLLFAGLLLLGSCKNKDVNKEPVSMETGKDYPVYGGNKAGNRYSPLMQINLDNVKNLELAWTYFANDPPDTTKRNSRGRETQCQPIVVNGILYGTSAEVNLFALDAGTGKQLWKFEPVKDNQPFSTNRGVMYWESGNDKRIFFTQGGFLYAVDALTGKAVTSFGRNGRVDLHEGLVTPTLGHEVKDLAVTATTPGVIFNNTLIMGSSVSESGNAAPGHVRAFDAVTGKLKWVFHTIPQPGEFGYDTWPKDAYKKIGAANSWGGMSVDEKRGVVYFGTGSPSSDFFGGDREGTNLFSNCIMALEAETGKMKWYFQGIHHDLWDRDFPCPPNLTTITRNGKKIDVVVQAGKDGFVYILNRDNGESIYPIEERAVPVNGLPGEHPYPTQKFLSKPASLTRQVMTEADITNISPESHEFVSNRFKEFPKTDNRFQPPTVEGTILFGYSGGAEWGGNAIDPNGVLYVNSNEAPWELKMVDKKTREREIATLSAGNALYIRNCASCHGAERKGNGDVVPSLVDIGKKRTTDEINNIMKMGNGRMPAFPYLSDDDRKSIIGFLLNKEYRLPRVADEHKEADTVAKPSDFPYQPNYTSKIWQRFSDQNGYNAITPPWGTLNAIDLNTGEYLWRIPLGEYPELTKKGIPITGTDTYGGPVVTASGLLFIASTKDERIRAFDKKTGKQVWEYQLPAGGFATPISYEVDGQQYIAIAAGGGRGNKPGGWYVAFRLKK